MGFVYSDVWRCMVGVSRGPGLNILRSSIMAVSVGGSYSSLIFGWVLERECSVVVASVAEWVTRKVSSINRRRMMGC